MNANTQIEKEQQPWERREEEPVHAHAIFCVYRDMPVGGRSLSRVIKELSAKPSYRRQLQLWSVRYAWVQRAALYDDHIERLKRGTREDAIVDLVYKEQLSDFRTLRDAARIAHFDPGRVVEWNDGAMVFKDSKELTEEERATVKKITFTYNKDGGVARKSIEFHDKIKALELLGRNQGLWEAEKSGDKTETNYAVWIQILSEGKLDEVIERRFGVKLPERTMFAAKQPTSVATGDSPVIVKSKTSHEGEDKWEGPCAGWARREDRHGGYLRATIHARTVKKGKPYALDKSPPPNAVGAQTDLNPSW